MWDSQRIGQSAERLSTGRANYLPMHYMLRRITAAFVAAVWAATAIFGTVWFCRYDVAAGMPADAPLQWPSDSHIARKDGFPVLVLSIHPGCPCTRATIGELAKLMTDCQSRLVTTVLVLRPKDMPDGWERTDLWSSAAAIPGVSVVTDNEGKESRQFGAATSGQALLYADDGRLLFAGGITESRGHSGDNAGRQAITSLVLNPVTQYPFQPAHTPVYGCSLFDGPATGVKEGSKSCQH